MRFNERKTIKNKYKKTKHELNYKVIEIKVEIEGSFIKNCIYSMKKRQKAVIKKTKGDKTMY